MEDRHGGMTSCFEKYTSFFHYIWMTHHWKIHPETTIFESKDHHIRLCYCLLYIFIVLDGRIWWHIIPVIYFWLHNLDLQNEVKWVIGCQMKVKCATFIFKFQHNRKDAIKGKCLEHIENHQFLQIIRSCNLVPSCYVGFQNKFVMNLKLFLLIATYCF